jgi:hypothetical protein
MSSSTVPKIDSVWKFLPQWRMSSLTLELENVLSHSKYLTRVAGPRRLSNEAQNKKSHEAQSDTTRCYVAHAQKEKFFSFKLSRYPPFPTINVPFIVLVPPTSIHKSQGEISLKGGGL